MTAPWPGYLNQRVMEGSYSEQPERNVASFSPEVGPPMERRRSAVPTDLASWTGSGTLVEYQQLKDFYRTTLRDGVLPFTRTNPLTGGLSTYKFRTEPKLTRTFGANGYWSIEVRLVPMSAS